MKKGILLFLGLLLLFWSCQNENKNDKKEELQPENAAVNAEQNSEEAAEEKKEEQSSKTALFKTVSHYANIKDFFDKESEITQKGAPLNLVSDQGTKMHEGFTQEDIDALFSGAQIFGAGVMGVVDAGDFMILHLTHHNNMASEENLVTWDKKEQKVISALNLTASASTSNYSFDSKTSMVGDNLFELVEQTEDFNDGTTKEEQKQYKFDPTTGNFEEQK
jgi:glycyl-tRNA synthetase (class II)